MTEHESDQIESKASGATTRLASNDILADIVEEFPHALPDWEVLFNRFREVHPNKKTDIDGVHGMLAELHLATYLESWERYTWLVDHYPIPSGSVKGDYEFRHYKGRSDYTVGGNLTAAGGKKAYAEYDALILAGHLPVVFEMKAGATMKKFQQVLRPEAISYKLKPVLEYFGVKEAGYVVIAPRDLIRKSSEIQQSFQAMGGILVPAYGSSRRLETDLTAARQQYGF